MPAICDCWWLGCLSDASLSAAHHFIVCVQAQSCTAVTGGSACLVAVSRAGSMHVWPAAHLRKEAAAAGFKLPDEVPGMGTACVPRASHAARHGVHLQPQGLCLVHAHKASYPPRTRKLQQQVSALSEAVPDVCTAAQSAQHTAHVVHCSTVSLLHARLQPGCSTTLSGAAQRCASLQQSAHGSCMADACRSLGREHSHQKPERQPRSQLRHLQQRCLTPREQHAGAPSSLALMPATVICTLVPAAFAWVVLDVCSPLWLSDCTAVAETGCQC